jgi:GxxExxY protein
MTLPPNDLVAPGPHDPESRPPLLHRDVTRVILGAFYAVHTELGFGFLEAVYKNAIVVLLRNAGVQVDREVEFDLAFHGASIGVYRADLIVESKVVVEVKSGRVIDPPQCAQLRNYLRASNLEVGLLLNFGQSAEFKRMISTRKAPSSSSG